MSINLMNEVQTLRVLYDKLKRQKGENFNVFLITGIGERETLFCKMIHDLLNPKGSHGQNNLYLRLFVQEVLKLPFEEEDYDTAIVENEFVIDDKRRIDLIIRTKNYIIPIEVKIYAGDQPKQCEDYAKWAKNSQLYYLTIDGREPSAGSMGALDVKEVQCLSFKEHILSWLQRCVTQQATVEIAAIREILLQMMDAIRHFSGLIGDEEMQETLTIVMRNKDTMLNARFIKEAYEKSRGEMIRKVFDRLQQDLKLEFCPGDDNYSLNNYASIRNYKSKNLPVMWHELKRDVIDGYHLYMYIEVDWYLYVGFTLINDKDEYININDPLENMMPYIKNKENTYWEHIPSTEESPNFNQPDLDDVFFDLFDEFYFEQFIEKCVKRVKDLVGNIRYPEK